MATTGPARRKGCLRKSAESDNTVVERMLINAVADLASQAKEGGVDLVLQRAVAD